MVKTKTAARYNINPQPNVKTHLRLFYLLHNFNPAYHFEFAKLGLWDFDIQGECFVKDFLPNRSILVNVISDIFDCRLVTRTNIQH